jgi:hypothetical protein
VLEVGVGSGVLVPTLTARYREYTGTDLTLAPGLDALVAPDCSASSARRSAAGRPARQITTTRSSASPCWSTSPIRAPPRAPGASLAPGGTLVCGYPMVSA